MDVDLFHEGIDRAADGAERGERARDVAIAREGDDAGVAEVLGEARGGAEQLDLGGLVELLGRKHARQLAFGRGRDAGHHVDAADGVLAGRGLAGEHDRVGHLEHRVGDVGHFGAGRHRGVDHRLEHVRGDDDGLAAGDGHGDGLALDEREGLVGDLDAEVAAGDHQGVGGLEDRTEVRDGGLVLDLGDDVGVGGMLREQGAERMHVGRFADERQRVEVDADLAADGDVGAVLVGEGGEVDFHAGEIDMAAAAERAGLLDLAAEAVLPLLEHAQLDEAVVDEHHAAHGHGGDHLRVVGRDDEDVPFGLGRFGAGDVDDLVDDELGGFLAGAGADFRAFDVHHHRQLLLQAKADFADAGDDGAHPGVVGVRHVQADDVRAGLDDGLQLGFGLGRRPDGESDAGVAEWLHVFYE